MTTPRGGLAFRRQSWSMGVREGEPPPIQSHAGGQEKMVGNTLARMTCIEDLRQVARRKVPRAFFDYAETGSYAQDTLAANRADLERIKLRQRVLVDVAARSTATTILGEPVALPLALAPIGLCGMQHGDGEILACRAAHAAGIPFTLSTMSICSIEDVARSGRQAVLVPALRHEGPRLHSRADRARGGGQLQRAGAHRRPAGAGPAPLRHPQRHDRAAGNPHQQSHRHRHQAGLGAEHRCAASARRSATSPATSKAWRTSPRCRNGSAASSIRR